MFEPMAGERVNIRRHFGTSAIILLPEIKLTYAGQSAIRVGMPSPAEGRRFYVFTDFQALLPLAVITEEPCSEWPHSGWGNAQVYQDNSPTPDGTNGCLF